MARTGSSAGADAHRSEQLADELGLRRVAPREWGYRAAEVEDLLGTHVSPQGPTAPGEEPRDRRTEPQQLRRAVFRRQRGGYAPADVDAAIDRLDDEAARIQARRRIREQGEQAWHEHVDAQLDLVLGRLERPAGHRFRAPSAVSTRGYSAPAVDELCDRLHEQLREHEAPETSVIRTAVFEPARGEGVYEEHQVDAFLDAVVDLLHSLD